MAEEAVVQNYSANNFVEEKDEESRMYPQEIPERDLDL